MPGFLQGLLNIIVVFSFLITNNENLSAEFILEASNNE